MLERGIMALLVKIEFKGDGGGGERERRRRRGKAGNRGEIMSNGNRRRPNANSAGQGEQAETDQPKRPRRVSQSCATGTIQALARPSCIQWDQASGRPKKSWAGLEGRRGSFGVFGGLPGGNDGGLPVERNIGQESGITRCSRTNLVHIDGMELRHPQPSTTPRFDEIPLREQSPIHDRYNRMTTDNMLNTTP